MSPSGTSQMGKKANKLNFYGAGKTNVILAAKETQTMVIHVHIFLSKVSIQRVCHSLVHEHKVQAKEILHTQLCATTHQVR